MHSPPETSLYNTTKAVIHSYSNDFADWCSDKPTNSFLRRSPERHRVTPPYQQTDALKSPLTAFCEL